MRKSWKKFIKKHSGKIEKILSWAINFGSLAFTIIGFMTGEAGIGWSVILAIVIADALFLVGATIYEAILYAMVAKKQRRLENEKNFLKNEKIKKLVICRKSLIA